MNACVLQAGVGVRTAAARGREVRRLRVQSYHHAAVSAAVGYAEGACAKTPASGSVPVPSVTSQGAQRVAPPPAAAASVPVAVSTDGSAPLIHAATAHRRVAISQHVYHRPDERDASCARVSACVVQAGVGVRAAAARGREVRRLRVEAYHHPSYTHAATANRRVAISQHVYQTT